MGDWILFYILAAGVLLSAVAVVLPPVGKNPIHAAISLIVCFFFLAAMYMSLGAHLVGAIQILVYAGAVMVLFTFVIMLLNLGPADLGEPKFRASKALGLVFAAFVLGKAFAAIQAATAGIGADALRAGVRTPGPEAAVPVDLGSPAHGSFGSIEDVGTEIFTGQLVPFELIGVLLLVAVVGAVVLAKKRIDYDPEPASGEGHGHGGTHP